MNFPKYILDMRIFAGKNTKQCVQMIKVSLQWFSYVKQSYGIVFHACTW